MLTTVAQVVDDVNMLAANTGGEESGRGYHHGNLRQALVTAGLELARAGGPNAVLLRAATRKAQVSHNAAYRHFASQEDLLAAVAAQCMTQLGLLMIERSDQVRARGPVRRAQARLEAIGRAYIDFARTEPGWFRTAFSSARPHKPDAPAAQPDDDATSPFLILGARLDDLVTVGALTPQRRQGAEFFAWSGVHGLSSLLVDGPLRDLPEPMVEHAIRTVLDSIARGLR
jgi:AcrR family transcriptional regulator